MKKRVAVLLAAVMMVMTACGGGSGSQNSTTAQSGTDTADQASGEEIVFKMGTQSGESSDWVKFCQRYSDKLNELSGGTMSIELITGGSLGTIAEHFSQMNQGTLDMMLQGCDAPSVAPGGKDFDILNLPFLFNDLDHWHKFLESDVLKEMTDSFQQQTNVKWLGVLNDVTPRALSTNEVAVYAPDDLKGLQIRVPGTALITDIWSSFGAMPVNMSMGDLMEALQTGRVDGQENGLSIVMQGYFEQQDYYSEINQTYQGITVFMSGVTYDKLTEEQQGWLTEALEITSQELREEYWDTIVPGYEEMLVETGIEIIPNEEIDIDAFKAIVEEKIPEYEGKYFSEGLYDRIKALDE